MITKKTKVLVRGGIIVAAILIGLMFVATGSAFAAGAAPSQSNFVNPAFKAAVFAPKAVQQPFVVQRPLIVKQPIVRPFFNPFFLRFNPFFNVDVDPFFNVDVNPGFAVD